LFVAGAETRVPLTGKEKTPEIAELLGIEPTQEIARASERSYLPRLQGVPETLKQ
jgi:hypothetical protein